MATTAVALTSASLGEGEGAGRVSEGSLERLFGPAQARGTQWYMWQDNKQFY